MSEVKRYYWNADDIDGLGYGSLDLLADASSQELVSGADFDRVTAERDAALRQLEAEAQGADRAAEAMMEWRRNYMELQQRLTAADGRFREPVYNANPGRGEPYAWKQDDEGKWEPVLFEKIYRPLEKPAEGGGDA